MNANMATCAFTEQGCLEVSYTMDVTIHSLPYIWTYLLQVYAFAAGVGSCEQLHLRCSPAHVHVIGDKVVDTQLLEGVPKRVNGPA